MHLGSWNYIESVRRVFGDSFVAGGRILEIGARNVNGTAKAILERGCREYIGLDTLPGPCVDIVADATLWRPPANDPGFDMVVSTSVLEHLEGADKLCRTAYDALKTPGLFVVTTYLPGNPSHAAVGGELRKGEFYRNVTPEEMREWLKPFSLVLLFLDYDFCDIAASALKL